MTRGEEVFTCGSFVLLDPTDNQTVREFVKLKDGRGWLAVCNSSGDREVVPLPQHRSSDSQVKAHTRNSVFRKKVSL
jgi:hypothetical protein